MLILSSESGLEDAPEGLVNMVGFHHGAASGDVDDDGDLDILVTNSSAPGTFLLVNDGSGSFSFDQSRLPDRAAGVTGASSPQKSSTWTETSGSDLLLAGHEYGSAGGTGMAHHDLLGRSVRNL